MTKPARCVRRSVSRTTTAAIAALLLSACADEVRTVLAPVGGLRSSARLSEWSSPQPITSINTTATEGCPFITKSGDVLYLASNRSGGAGNLDLYTSRWNHTTQTWGAPVNAADINTASNEQCPLVLNSGKELIFVSDRSGGAGGLDVWMATRDDHDDDGAWGSPVNLSALNSGAAEFGPGAYEDENGTLVIYFNSNRAGGPGNHDLYTSARPVGGTFSAPTPVMELNSNADEQFAAVTKDGREIVFSSNRTGGSGGLDLWSATRERTSDAWGAPVNLGANVNSSAAEARSTISWDGKTLIFHSTRAGSADLYQSSRVRVTGKPDRD